MFSSRLANTIIFLAACLVLCFAATVAPAAPWAVKGDYLPTDAQERLHQKFPTIEDAQTLQNLLRTIARQYHVLALEALFEDGVWQIRGQAARQIADIELDTITRFLHTPLYSQLQKYIGQVDAEAIRQKIEESSKHYLQTRGYPLASVSTRREEDDDRLIYHVSIDEGEPCVIERVEVGFTVPDNVKLPLQRGAICDHEDIEKAVDSLELKLREFGYNQLKINLADIEYNRSTNTASIYISGILGQRIRYEIIDKNRGFLISDLFGDEELTDIDPTIVGPDAMAAELERRYRNNGFLDVVVKGPTVSRDGQDLFVYRYEVDPGVRYILTNVEFEGVTVFTEDELSEVIGSTSLWQSTKPLNLTEIEQGVETLRGLYQTRGYWDVNIRDPGRGAADKETGTVRMTIRVEEGLPHVLKTVDINGVTHSSPEDIRALLDVKQGDPLDKGELIDFQQDVRSLLIANGYLYANVELNLSTTTEKNAIQTTLTVEVKEGPRVRIGDITISGLVKTEEKVVRRELLFATGDWYNPDRIANSRKALTRLGLFRAVQIVPSDRNAITRKESELDLVVQLAEGRAGNVAFGPGWDFNRGWLYSAEASYNNIGGTGRKASVRGSFSEEAHQGGIGNKTLVGRKLSTGYVEPYIAGLPVDATVTVSHRAEAAEKYWVFKYGGRLGLVHNFRDWLDNSRIELFYDQEIAKTEGSRELEEDLVARDARIGRMGTSFMIDARNSRQFPTGGSFFETELAWARYEFVGDMRYFKWGVRHHNYFEVIDNLVVALGISLTSFEDIERKGDTIDILPISERLSLGGSGSVRGFQQDDLGPVVRTPSTEIYEGTADASAVGSQVWDCGYQRESPRLGGTQRSIVNLELRYKLTESAASAFFVDSGNVFFSQDQMDRFAEAYSSPAAVAPSDPDWKCPNQAGFRSVEDNVGYKYQELLKNPKYLYQRHYLGYGIAGAYLSPLGSINLSYGLPMHEPKTAACRADESFCEVRGKTEGYWLFRGAFNFYIAAEF